MRKSAFALVLVLCAFALSACTVVYGPSGNLADAEYVQSVQAVLEAKESVKITEKAYLLGNTKAPGPAQSWGVFGTLVVTDKTLYFLFWNRNSNTFDVVRKLPLADIAEAEHITSVWGPGDYILIKDKNDRPDLVTCYEMYAAHSMIEKNRALLDYLNAARQSK